MTLLIVSAFVVLLVCSNVVTYALSFKKGINLTVAEFEKVAQERQKRIVADRSPVSYEGYYRGNGQRSYAEYQRMKRE